MCHVIATSVRSSGFWWANCWSALHSHVRSDITFGSLVAFFVKAFLWFADKKVLLRFWRHLLPFPFPCSVRERSLRSLQPRQSSDTTCIDLGWGSMVNQWEFLHWLSLFLYRHHLPWSPFVQPILSSRMTDTLLSLRWAYSLQIVSPGGPWHHVLCTYVCIWPCMHMCTFLVARCFAACQGPRILLIRPDTTPEAPYATPY